MSGGVGRMVAVLLGLAFALAGCGRTYEWHQKLTVEVMTPHGVVRGSSVIAVHIRRPPGWESGFTKKDYSSGKSGEATVVEVSPGHFLFVLLDNSQFNHLFFPKMLMSEAAPKLERLRDRRTVPRSDYPPFVTFTDPLVPTSVRAVDPDRLDAVFGPGYRLSSITVEITDEPVTRKITAILPWLGDPNGLKDLRWSSLPSFVTSSISRLYAGPIERPKP